MRYLLIHCPQEQAPAHASLPSDIAAAGYDVIDCADLGEAVDVASRHPTARLGAIEIRPMARD